MGPSRSLTIRQLISFGFGRHAIVTGTGRRIFGLWVSFGFSCFPSDLVGLIENTDRLSLFEVCLGETEARKQFLVDEKPTN